MIKLILIIFYVCVYSLYFFLPSDKLIGVGILFLKIK
jgi:hypothetical protein